MNKTKVIHSADCRMAFGRYDKSCPRCQELIKGAPARAGWNSFKQAQEAITLRAIAAHDFAACAKANGVCTHFDW